jgi:putative transposase
MPSMKREAFDTLVSVYQLSIRKASKLLGIARSTLQYQKKPKDDIIVIEHLDKLTQKHVNIGFWSCYYRLRNRQIVINHKRLYRVYTDMKLNLRRRRKKRLPTRLKQELAKCTAQNQVWSMDFLSDKLTDSRSFRILNIIDDYSRESLKIDIDISMPSRRVIHNLNELAFERGYPSNIRVDNGPEFISTAIQVWCEKHRINLLYIQPGKPMQNGYVERNNGSMRQEVLDAYMFRNLSQARDLIYQWQEDYNEYRPHSALGYLSPRMFITEQTIQ